MQNCARGLLRFAVVAVFAGVSMGCASQFMDRKIAQKTAEAMGGVEPQVVVVATPFIEQRAHHCGPATLTMALQKWDSEVSLKQVTGMTFTPGAKGSFKPDMLSAARRLGYAPYQVSSFQQMLDSLKAGHPVVVFQDLGFAFVHVWHYAVLVGYDAKTDSLIVHSGPNAYERMRRSQFVMSWQRGGEWSYIFLRPTDIPGPADFNETLANADIFSKIGRPVEAIAVYRAIRNRWPERFEADAGLAFEYAQLGALQPAIQASQSAIQKNPEHSGLYFNLAYLYRKAGQTRLFEKTKSETLARVPEPQRDAMVERFEQLQDEELAHQYSKGPVSEL